MKSDIKILERELREPREQTSNNKGSRVTQSVPRLKLIENEDGPPSREERPCYKCYLKEWELNQKIMPRGVYYHGEEPKKNNQIVEVDELICSPLKILASTASLLGDTHGRLIWLIDAQGVEHTWSFPMSLLRGDCEELRGELLNLGLTFEPKNRSHIGRYLMQSIPDDHQLATTSIGWVENENTFVLPNRVIGSAKVSFQSENPIDNDFSTSGSLSGWQEDIGQYCDGNSILVLSLCAALAGPLLKIVGRSTIGLHWFGDSSSGKSTALEVSASVWGSPDFVRSWRSTSNGLEGIATVRNDTFLPLDEIGEASPLEIANTIYMLGNGQGRQRAGRGGNARKIHRWKTSLLSAGERTVESIMDDIGKKPNTGLSVRLLNLPADSQYGVFNDLHHFKSGRELADHLKLARRTHYGHLGPAFIERLMAEHGRDFCSELEAITKILQPLSKNGLETRALSVFSLLGFVGILSMEWGVLPLKKTDPIKIIEEFFIQWRSSQASEQTESEKILQAIREFLIKHGDSRFSSIENIGNASNRAGWYKDTSNGRIYLFPGETLKEICKFDISRIGKALKSSGWLVEHDLNRINKKTRVHGLGFKNLYYIREPDPD